MYIIVSVESGYENSINWCKMQRPCDTLEEATTALVKQRDYEIMPECLRVAELILQPLPYRGEFGEYDLDTE